MKILHATDLHFVKSWYDYLLSIEKDYDVVCVTGDLVDGNDPKGIDYQIKQVVTMLYCFKKPLFVCSGNHDVGLPYDEYWLEGVVGVFGDNSIHNLNGITFGCATCLNPQYATFSNCDVLLSHYPPAYTKASCDIGGGDYGSEKLYNSIAKGIIAPKIILCGHIHRPRKNICRFKNSVIYNPGCDFKSKIPRINSIEI